MGQPYFDLLSGENLGSVLIAFSISLILFGIVVIQAYTYYLSFPDDKAFLKILAGIVLLLEAAHSFSSTSMLYHDIIIHRGFLPIGPNSYPLAVTALPSIFVIFLIQCFFVFRIHRLCGTRYVYTLYFLLFLRFVGNFTGLIEVFIDVPRVPNMVTIISNLGWFIALTFIMGAVVDVIIAASLCYCLKHLAPEEQRASTSQILNRLLLWSVQTGIITSMTSTGIAISFLLRPHAELWFALYIISTKLYSNSFFLSLNMRRNFREKPASQIDVSGCRFYKQASVCDGSGVGTQDEALTGVAGATNITSAEPISLPVVRSSYSSGSFA